MRGSEGRAERWMKAPPHRPHSAARVPGPRVLCRWQVRSGWVRRHEGEEEEDNEGVCGPPVAAAGDGEVRGGLTDKTARWTERRWKEKDNAKERKRRRWDFKQGWRRGGGGCAPSAERRAPVWTGGTNKAASKPHPNVYHLLSLQSTALRLYLCACWCQPPSPCGFVSMRQ